tara:strand:- start:2375 stop:2803 length:429 start_codon:yes stop_codon:yes gene_type:complete
MKKGKGKSKKNIKKSNKSLSKEVKKKKGVSNSNKSIKSSKATKKSNKSKLSLKQKAKKILSKETWRDTRDIKGKLKKGRKKSIKLITQGDANRYQQIVKAISDYYKKAVLDVWVILIIYLLLLYIIICLSAYQNPEIYHIYF